MRALNHRGLPRGRGGTGAVEQEPCSRVGSPHIKETAGSCFYVPKPRDQWKQLLAVHEPHRHVLHHRCTVARRTTFEESIVHVAVARRLSRSRRHGGSLIETVASSTQLRFRRHVLVVPCAQHSTLWSTRADHGILIVVVYNNIVRRPATVITTNLPLVRYTSIVNNTKHLLKSR